MRALLTQSTILWPNCNKIILVQENLQELWAWIFLPSKVDLNNCANKYNTVMNFDVMC